MVVRECFPGERNIFKFRLSAGVHHAFECGKRPQRGLALPYDGFRKRQAVRLGSAADIGARVENIVALFEYPRGFVPGNSGIIVGSDALKRYLKAEDLALAGLESARLIEAAEHPCGLSELPLRRGAVYLHDFPAGGASGVLYVHASGDLIAVKFEIGSSDIKACV